MKDQVLADGEETDLDLRDHAETLEALDAAVKDCIARVASLIAGMRGEQLSRTVEWALALTGAKTAGRNDAGEILIAEDPTRFVRVFDGGPLTKEDVRRAAREHETGSRVTLVSNKPVAQEVVLNAYIHVNVEINTLGPEDLARAIVAGVALGDT